MQIAQTSRAGRAPFRAALLAVPALLLALAAGPALAAETISVTLWDKGDMAMATDLGVGMKGDHAAATMGVTPDKTTVKAGEITFNATNTSTTTIHEMLVLPMATADAAPPYDEGQSEIDEEAVSSMGEVSELDPGKSGSLTVTLQPGLYLLVCNQPGHYAAGMWTLLTVTP